MSEFLIQDGTREQVKMRLALQGPSGAGKSVTSLLIAKGMAEAMLEAGVFTGTIAGKIGVIDTEKRSSRLYSHIVPFKLIELNEPYSPERYIGALKAFEDAGIPIVIVDQMSHAWAGKGGVLEMKDKAGDGWAGWKEATPIQNEFIERLLSSSCHLILTMRSKTEWTTEEYTDKHGNRKSRPKRLGMAPVQRAGVEYEFTTLLSLETDTNFATSLKDRTEIFAGLNETPQRLNESWGKRLAAWLHDGVVPAPTGLPPTPAERAEGMVKVWEGTFVKSQSLPDLAVAFEQSITDLVAFGDSIGQFLKKTLRDRLIAAKDVRKAQLQPTATLAAVPGGKVEDMPLDPLEVDMLEQFLVAYEVPMAKFSEKFGVVRLAQLPAVKVLEARDWIKANGHRKDVA